MITALLVALVVLLVLGALLAAVLLLLDRMSLHDPIEGDLMDPDCPHEDPALNDDGELECDDCGDPL